MTAMPQQMPASEIAAHHEPTPCDHCGEPAMMLVRADDAHCRSFRCESCGLALITSFADRGVDVSAEILRSGQQRSAKAAFVVDALMRRPFSVEQADASVLVEIENHEDFPVLDDEEPETCRYCRAVLTEENTGKHYGGCCVECEHVAHDEYVRYGRDDE